MSLPNHRECPTDSPTEPNVDGIDVQPGGANPHYHLAKDGTLVKCYHGVRSFITDWRFWFGVTFSFPIEHALYEHVWPFTIVGRWFGL